MKFYILIFIIIIVFYYYKNSHNFWNKQPVSRKSLFSANNEGVITKPKYFKTEDDLDKNFSWTTISDIDNFKNFLQSNYSKSEIYSKEYLQFILNSPIKHIIKIKDIDRSELNIGLKYKDKLIGSIIGRPIILKININIIEGFYVDFLCIDKQYRGKNLAPKLINKLLCKWKKYKLDAHFFKIDFKPLPFDYIGKFNYYYYDLSQDNIIVNKNIIIKRLDETMLIDTYKFFYDNISKYKIYQIFTFDEFRYYFLSNKFIHSFVILEKDIITGFITFIEMKHKDPTKKSDIVNCIELIYFLTNTPNIIYNFLEIFKSYDYLIFLDAMQNKTLINILHPNKSHVTYYHLYNYMTNIYNEDIGIIIA
jgi:hypothetical protein